MDEADLRAGRAVMVVDDNDSQITIALIDDGELVNFNFEGDKLTGTFARPAPADLDKQLRDDWRTRLCAFDDRTERVRAALRRSHALIAQLSASIDWLPLGTDFLVHDDAAGILRVFDSGTIRACTWFGEELRAAAWANPALALVAPPAERAAAVGTLVDAIHAQLAQLDAGTHALVDGSTYVELDTRIVAIALDDLAKLDFNPHRYVIARAKLIERLVELEGKAQIVPIPPAIQELAPRIIAALRQTRAEIVDKYVAAIRGGTTISGGPTTDQSWTVASPDGKTFTISGYDSDGPRTDPLDEAELRRMIARFSMFGLADLPA